ncbi:MAG: hypothetical protein GKS00_06515 [Alphaproteobacteria bacterium]|nr:hypothetical protein [Alphaproteobacteria bacterium]
MAKSATLEVLDMEALQVGQTWNQSIPLFAERATAVRVYVRPHTLDRRMRVRGTLAFRCGNGGDTQIVSTNDLQLDPNGHPSIELQRKYTGAALTFLLPQESIKTDGFSVELLAVDPIIGGLPGVEVQSHDKSTFSVEAGPSLRLRTIGLRMQCGECGRVDEPRPQDFEAIRHYIERAFPIGRLEWSTRMVDAPAGFVPPLGNGKTPDLLWQARHDRLIAYLMALRARDVAFGTDYRTHYYGLVSDPDYVFAGAVSDVPDSACPGVLAAGPATSDGALGAHEIAHALGGLHPGYGGEQQREDDCFPPESRGHLSTPEEDFHGFDIGSSYTSPKVLDGSRWYDLMTYRSKLWVSAYRHRKLLSRIRAEDIMAPPEQNQSGIAVIGTFALEDIKGAPEELGNRFHHVFPADIAEIAAETQGIVGDPIVEVRGMDTNGVEIFRHGVKSKRAEATDLHQDSGAFMVAVPQAPNLHALELWVQQKRVAEYPMPAACPEDETGWAIQIARSGGLGHILSIDWPDNGWTAPVTVVAVTGSGPEQILAVDLKLKTPTVFLDSSGLSSHSPIEVKLICPDGFGERVVFAQHLDLPRA